MTFDPKVIQAADIVVEYTSNNVYICAEIDGQEIKLQLRPLDAIMVGSAVLEAGKCVLNKPE